MPCRPHVQSKSTRLKTLYVGSSLEKWNESSIGITKAAEMSQCTEPTLRCGKHRNLSGSRCYTCVDWVQTAGALSSQSCLTELSREFSCVQYQFSIINKILHLFLSWLDKQETSAVPPRQDGARLSFAAPSDSYGHSQRIWQPFRFGV
jgi:hypothetical protein